MGSKLFSLGRRQVPFPTPLKDLLYPEGQHREAACPLAARAESQQRAALGVAEEGRVEPKPGTAVSRVLPCTLLFPSCICPIPAAGMGAQGTARVRIPAVTLELRCVHTGLVLAREEYISQVHNYSFLCWAREEGGEQRMEPERDKTHLA